MNEKEENSPQISQIHADLIEDKDMETPASDPQTYALIGAAMAVHTELGPGFLEPVYQEALKLELEERIIPVRDEVKLRITYRGRMLETFGGLRMLRSRHRGVEGFTGHHGS